MAKSRNGLTAAAFLILGTSLVLVAFSTKNWIVADGKLENPKFDRIGLWVVCFKNFEDPHHWYDTKFTTCWWTFEQEHSIIAEVLFQDFYICTQILFSCCVFLTLVGLYYTVLYLYCDLSLDHLTQILLTIWRYEIASAICGASSLVIFAIHGNSRIWMPEWEHKNFGWSFVVAIIGVVLLHVSAILYFIEDRVHKIKRQQMTVENAVPESKQLSNINE